jgi:hypothetical protein
MTMRTCTLGLPPCQVRHEAEVGDRAAGRDQIVTLAMAEPAGCHGARPASLTGLPPPIDPADAPPVAGGVWPEGCSQGSKGRGPALHGRFRGMEILMVMHSL